MKKNDLFYQTAILLAAIEGKSLGSAALKFDISVSQASRHIKALETRLGTKLVETNSKGIAPTTKGLYFATQIRPILTDVIGTETALIQGAQSRAKLTFPFSIGTNLFAEWITVFQKEHPEVDLRLSLDFPEKFNTLEHDELRVIMSKEPPEARVIARKLCDIKLINIANKEIASDKEKFDTKEKLISLTETNQIKIYYCTKENPDSLLFTNKKESEEFPAKALQKIDTYLMLKALVRAGAGIGVGIPKILVENELATGALAEVFPQWSVDETALWLLRLPQRYTSLLSHQLSSSLMEECKSLVMPKMQ